MSQEQCRFSFGFVFTEEKLADFSEIFNADFPKRLSRPLSKRRWLFVLRHRIYDSTWNDGNLNRQGDS